MIIQASNGCLLTQSGEVEFKERRFEKSMLVVSMDEAANWKEIPESEKTRYEQEIKLFEPEELNFDFIQKVDSLVSFITEKMNTLGLNSDEALSLKKYFPDWENSIGQYAYAGYKYLVDSLLVEVVTPHELSLDKNPLQQPMLLSIDSENMENVPVYFKEVVGSKSEE
ncbi:hypothetical protein [Bacteroides mediterraneensis]|uniref:Uncharacterized protein n=1 Tax=Bacteroides mediterraneensis TaxID=1841856 RepID=A0ABS2ESK3_9BACE|nr:hypothetical protein [Bacteroides mediterraneensis]MBM6757373.1 hypothetical protein [Bacteroides mediterraneensis]